MVNNYEVDILLLIIISLNISLTSDTFWLTLYTHEYVKETINIFAIHIIQ